MTVTAKFKVQRVTPHTDGHVDSHYSEIELVPDYAGGRNKDWSKYTPSGVMRMNVSNPAALEIMMLGKAFTVTFEENTE